MRLTMAVCALALVSGCKKKDGQAGSANAAAGSGSASVAGGSASAAPSNAGSGLAFDVVEPDPDQPDVLQLAFGGKEPRLPAVSADGTLYADLESTSGGPMWPPPYDLVFRAVNAAAESERTTILTFDEANKAGGDSAGSAWKTPAIVKLLEGRGAAVVKKLAGFHSLTAVKLEDDKGDAAPTKIRELTLVPIESDVEMTLELRDAKGAVLQRATVESYSSGSGDNICGYSPRLWAAGTDGPMLYLSVGYHYRDDCDPPQPSIFAWSLDPAKADPAALAAGLVAHQFEAAPAITPITNSPGLQAKAKGQPMTADEVELSRDGQTAWASGIVGDAARASDVLVKTQRGWQLAAAAWTAPLDNAAANRDAKAGKLAPKKLDGVPGDPSLGEAFKKLATDGVDAAAAKRPGLVAIGSGPGERTVGGAGFARAWNAAWKGKVTVDQLVAQAAPSGTTGWVAATIELQKPGYKIPFTVFAVFDKGADGAWSLVHIHFAV